MKPTHYVALLAGSLMAWHAAAQDVKMEKRALTLPTYEIGAPDVNPIFYTGRTYQGAQGHIYPYPLYDILTDQKTDKSYKGLYLENKWLDVCVLPEMGGRIFSATDKKTGYDFFYRQTGIKPALIGMLGAWLSGGVEWNFPHHHRPSSYMDIDYTLEENADGSKTIWVGETELRHRFKWSIGVTVHPDRSYVEAKVRIMNRSPFVQSMLYWANVSVHCGPDYEVIFPPSTEYGTDHSKVAFTPWPMGEISRGSGRMEDLARWKNFTGSSRSIFAWNFEDDFLAGYDHGKNAGTVHVANHHIVNGKKFFLWGNNPSAQMWDKMLSDNDGPYLELMVGAYSDNQPDYSWIGPGEVREFSQFWYPIRDIKDVKAANYDAALNLDRVAPDSLFVGYNTTALFNDAKVVVKNGSKVLLERVVTIDPDTPFTLQFPIPDSTDNDRLTAALYDRSGKELIAYSPVRLKEDPMPEVVSPVKSPKDFGTIEELYQAGLRIEQFHNARLNPMEYYGEALRRDSLDSRVNTVVGIRLARQGKWEEAEQHFLRAIQRQTQNYTITKDPEAYYNLGVVYQQTGRVKEASDCFWKATWYPTFQSPAYFSLAQISCVAGDYQEALRMIEASLNVNARHTKALTVQAYIRRKLGDTQAATALLRKVLEIDPLDYWALSELSFCKGEGARFLSSADDTRGQDIIKQQELLEMAVDYGSLGAYEEAIALLDEAVTLEAPYASFPLIYYYAGYYHSLKGDGQSAGSFRKGSLQPAAYCFPFRLEELQILQTAIRENARDAQAYQLYGDLLYYLEHKAEAVSAWEQAALLNPKSGQVERNLGFAYERNGKMEQAVAAYEKSVKADPSNPRTLIELDALYQRTGKPATNRLAWMQKHLSTVMKHDDAVIRLLGLYNETGQYDKAIRILDTRHFHVWEGGGQVHDLFVDAHLLKGLSLLRTKKYEAAVREFETADTYPENLEVGRPATGRSGAKIYYYIGLASKEQGNTAKAQECFEKSAGTETSGGRSRGGRSERDIYRTLSLQQLGKTDEANKLIASCREYVEQQLSSNSLIDEYSKFGEDGSQSQRLAQVFYLSGLTYYAQGDRSKAAEEFDKALKANRNLIWPKQFR